MKGKGTEMPLFFTVLGVLYLVCWPVDGVVGSGRSLVIWYSCVGLQSVTEYIKCTEGSDAVWHSHTIQWIDDTKQRTESSGTDTFK